MRRARHSLAIALAIACAASLSCKVNDYCLNCETGDGGNDGPDDGGGDGQQDGPVGDGGGPCVPTGPEVCDNKDNDCDGIVDNGSLPTVGDPCAEQRGECAGAVKQCVAGAIVCSKSPKPEQCNGKDDDCDGVNDNGDPSDALHLSGSKCGTNAGECTQGTFHCRLLGEPGAGTVTCGFNCGVGTVAERIARGCPIGGENAPFGTITDATCNGQDDNCNGQFDEDASTGLPCGGGAFNVAPSICVQGNFQCVGGGTVCIGSIDPQAFELCDQLDNDCDGNVDEDFDLKTDPTNCGACGTVCTLDHAFEGCADPDGNGPLPPACTVLACETGFHNNDGDPATGCEFGPCTITGTVEVCNGIDDDCNPATGNNGPPPGNLTETGLAPPVGFTCLSQGACAGAVPVCTGAGGFRCSYGPNVSQDANGNVIPETKCDTIDNDCDGATDENQPNLDDACLEAGQQGICQGSGTFQCDTSNVPASLDGPAVCVITTPGGTSKPEECNNLDDDCDGVVDNGANAGTLTVGQEWVNIPGLTGVQIMKYEASRRDSTDTFDGTTSNFACSTAGRQPWTNITYPQAKAVCDSMNGGAGTQARLCTEAEWQQMCMPHPTQPVPGPATAAVTDFTFLEAEDFMNNETFGGRTWTRTSPLSFNGITFMQQAEAGFSQPVIADAPTQSSRLDFQMTLNANTDYNVWVRGRSLAAPSINPAVLSTAPNAGTTSANSPAGTAIGDLVLVLTWTTTTAGGVPNHTVQAGFTLLGTLGNDDGNNDSRLTVAFTVATTAGAQPFQAVTASAGTSVTGLLILPAGSFDIEGMTITGNTDDGNNDPNPPTSAGLAGSFAPARVFAIGGWHYGSTSTTSNVTPPGSFTEVWEVAGASTVELSLAQSNTLQTAGTTQNPGAFDGSNPINNTGLTLSIPLPSSVYVGINQGTTAGNAQRVVPIPGLNTTYWRNHVAPIRTGATGGTHTISVYLREDGVMIDTVAVARQGTTGPTFDSAWAYETNPRVEQATTCNSDDFDTDGATGGDQDDNLPSGSKAACFANHADPDDAFDLSGNVKEWTLARSANQNPLRGGAANNEANGTTCQLNFTLADDTFFFPNAGFRCCRGP